METFRQTRRLFRSVGEQSQRDMKLLLTAALLILLVGVKRKKKERGKQEVQSVRVFFYVIIHTATRESSLCCPGWQSDVSAVTSKNRVNRVSVVSLRIHYPWVFNASLCRMLLPVTHNSRRAQREKKTLQQTDQPREKSATFLVKQIASGCDLTHGDKSSLLYKSHKRRATE